MTSMVALQPATPDAQRLLDTLGHDVCALAAIPVDARTGDPGERIETLHRLRAQLDAQLLTELSVFETRSGHRAAGCKSVGGWVRLHLRQTHTAAGHTVGTARSLGALPAAARALADGEISLEHVDAIAAGIKRVGAIEMARHEHTLVDLARTASAAEVRAAVTEIVRLIEAESDDGDAADRRAAEAEASRRFESRRVGDQVVFNGATDLATGEALTNYLQAHSKPVPGPDGGRDQRTPTQRRADAFAGMVEAAVDTTKMPERVRSTAAITMTLGIETLMALQGSTALLERLGVIPNATARRLLCDGTLTRIILDPAGDPIDINTCGRAHTTGQAKALALLHPTCAFPGCGVPFRMCHIHHVEHWVDGGPTELANLLPLCGTHHRWHHEGGYRIDVHPGRVFGFRDPRGRTIPDPTARFRPPPHNYRWTHAPSRRTGTGPPGHPRNSSDPPAPTPTHHSASSSTPVSAAAPCPPSHLPISSHGGCASGRFGVQTSNRADGQRRKGQEANARQPRASRKPRPPSPARSLSPHLQRLVLPTTGKMAACHSCRSRSRAGSPRRLRWAPTGRNGWTGCPSLRQVWLRSGS